MQKSKYRLQVWFTGRVQGVGFRYKALQISKGYDVTGYVENLDDGRVYMTAQGEEAQVRAFAEDLKKNMASFIKNADEKSDFYDFNFKEFAIKP